MPFTKREDLFLDPLCRVACRVLAYFCRSRLVVSSLRPGPIFLRSVASRTDPRAFRANRETFLTLAPPLNPQKKSKGERGSEAVQRVKRKSDASFAGASLRDQAKAKMRQARRGSIHVTTKG